MGIMQSHAITLLDTVSIGILLGALLVLAGIMSSLVAMRFGAPLLLVFLIVGMLAGEAGPGGIKFDDVRATYVVGSIALALILFDGGLRTRLATFRSVLAPAVTLATVGRHAHGGADRAGRQIPARHELERGAAGGRGRGLDRCGGGVLPGSCPRPAPAPARRRHARGRIRQQRSVRGPAHRPPGRVSVGGRRVVGTRRSRCWPSRRCSAPSSAFSAAAPWCSCSTGSRWRRACTRRS